MSQRQPHHHGPSAPGGSHSKSGQTQPEQPDTDAHEAEAVILPIDGTLDLHAFSPSDCLEVLRAYIEAATEAGLSDLRIVHGKGIGTLRELVHAELRRNTAVASFSLADAGGGGWGATLVRLVSPEKPTAIP